MARKRVRSLFHAAPLFDWYCLAGSKQNLAAELYAASLMAIEVDTSTEKACLGRLASGLGLAPEVTRGLDETVGLQPV